MWVGWELWKWMPEKYKKKHWQNNSLNHWKSHRTRKKGSFEKSLDHLKVTVPFTIIWSFESHSTIYNHLIIWKSLYHLQSLDHLKFTLPFTITLIIWKSLYHLQSFDHLKVTLPFTIIWSYRAATIMYSTAFN